MYRVPLGVRLIFYGFLGARRQMMVLSRAEMAAARLSRLSEQCVMTGCCEALLLTP